MTYSLAKIEKNITDLINSINSTQKIDISKYTLPETVTEIHKQSNGVYLIKLSTTGYSSDMVIMCAVSPEGKVVESTIVSSNLENPKLIGNSLLSKET